MGKKCIICNGPASYMIKGTADYYCQDCAQENFADLTLLLTLEDEAQRLKDFIAEKIDDENL